MINIRKSLIDNWSLELAGVLLDNDNDYFSFSNENFITSLGGLSNYINAMLLYDETCYLANGFDTGWKAIDWFEKNTNLFFKPINPESLNIDWNSPASYSDKGIKNYLISTKHLETDLFVSPIRADKIIELSVPNLKDNFDITIKKIDEKIKFESESSWYDNIKVGIDNNFKFPTMTQYVFSQASSLDDLLTVIIQLKTSGKIKNIRDKIDEIAYDTKKSGKFQKEIERLIKVNFGETVDSPKPWSLNFTVLFLTLTKSFNLDFFKREEFLLFLKDVIACRSEAYRINKDISRIFNRTIK